MLALAYLAQSVAFGDVVARRVAPDGRLLVVDYGAARVVALEPPAGLR